jgi:hypothetical protein
MLVTGGCNDSARHRRLFCDVAWSTCLNVADVNERANGQGCMLASHKHKPVHATAVGWRLCQQQHCMRACWRAAACRVVRLVQLALSVTSSLQEAATL